ncbi:MAG TPA: DNA recombination protein RmuC [Vicinamibacterales bacterium]|nr:DNA recombination protein RmuC [Vicinamibacterales bacterium]
MTVALIVLAAMLAAGAFVRAIYLRRLAEAQSGLAADLAAARALAQDAQRRLAVLEANLEEREGQLTAIRTEHAALKQDHHWLGEEVVRHRGSLESTQELLETADRRLRETFQSLAAEALHTNRGTFLELARASFEGLHKEAALQMDTRQQAFDHLMLPIADALKRVDVRLDEVERERLQTFSRLMEQVSALGATTHTLARALRTPNVRGRWGEMQLRRAVEIAGMLHRCDFDEQRELFAENGRLRPDLIVHLPGSKRIVVDAKAPLEAFLDAQESVDDEGRLSKLQAHSRQVRDHMDKLGAKAYWEQLEESPELVVMFLPGETLFSAALQHDLTLIEYGLSQRVLLASPITLIALLTTIAHTWRQEALTENYREVAAVGREFYDRLAKFTEFFDDIRKRLDGAVQAYNQAAGSFETRVLVSARRLRDLKVTTAPELPAAEPIDTVPRVLKQAGLMGLPDEATVEADRESARPGPSRRRAAELRG